MLFTSKICNKRLIKISYNLILKILTVGLKFIFFIFYLIFRMIIFYTLMRQVLNRKKIQLTINDWSFFCNSFCNVLIFFKWKIYKTIYSISALSILTICIILLSLKLCFDKSSYLFFLYNIQKRRNALFILFYKKAILEIIKKFKNNSFSQCKYYFISRLNLFNLTS